MRAGVADEGRSTLRHGQATPVGATGEERVLAEVARDRRTAARLICGVLLVPAELPAPPRGRAGETPPATAREVERGEVAAITHDDRARGDLRRQPHLREQARVVAGIERPARASGARIEALEASPRIP